MNSEFTGPEEELRRLEQEISLLRRDLQQTTATLGRIERRLKATFSNYPEKKKVSNAKINEQSLNSEQLNIIFEELVSCTKIGGDSEFSSRINKENEETIILLELEIRNMLCLIKCYCFSNNCYSYGRDNAGK